MFNFHPEWTSLKTENTGNTDADIRHVTEVSRNDNNSASLPFDDL